MTDMTTKSLLMKRAPAAPGDILKDEFMEPLNLTQARLADLAKVPRRRINEIIRKKRDITPDTALRLEAVFGVSAQFWLNLQMKWDLWRTLQEKAAEYGRLRRIKAA